MHRPPLSRFVSGPFLLILLAAYGVGGGGRVMGLSPALAASPDISIAAVVNDEAISNADVAGRVRLALLGATMQPPPEIVARLRAQILRAMVDERIQLQEATRLGLKVEDDEINRELVKLSQQNGVPPDKLGAFFASRGVPLSALKEQIRANLAWGKVVQTRIRPQIVVAEDEVDAEIARLQTVAQGPQFLVATIVLPVDKPQEEEAVRQTGLRLVEQMARGARFSAVARQFSRDSTAASGGDLGWVTPDQLDPAVMQTLARMKPGTVSPPIRTPAGFQIVMLREAKQGVGERAGMGGDSLASTSPLMTLRQVRLPVGTPDAVRKLEGLRTQAKSCADMERLAKAQGDSSGGDLGQRTLESLPPALQPLLSTLPIGQPSAALKNAQGYLFLMVCDRSAPAAPKPEKGKAGSVPASPLAPQMDRTQITNTLGGQKLELQARRYLRDLRQEAFVDIRS